MLAPEAMNCAAPDSGNMEVFAHFARPDLQERWLKPLLDGTIRSAYSMSEPDVASSDADNIANTIELEGRADELPGTTGPGQDPPLHAADGHGRHGIPACLLHPNTADRAFPAPPGVNSRDPRCSVGLCVTSGRGGL